MTSDPRVLVVTGASSGIGRAVALQSAEAGDHVVLVARGEPPLQQVARECEAAGAASALVLPTDVGDDAEVEKLMTAVTSQHGRIDAVVHCAGVVAYGRTEEVPVDVFDGVLRTNLTGSVNIARHAIPVLRRQRAGSLVLFGSVIGHIGVPGMSAYVLSKWGVRALARQLQLENRDLDDVTIAYVAPGGVDTPIYEQAANYDGFAGRPPPPVLSPERVARITLRRLDRHRARTQVGIANDLMRFGFNAVPWAFDMLVGPLFRFGAIDRTTHVEPTQGNVLESNFAGNLLHGAQGNALVGIGRNVIARVTGKDKTG
ncbi:SDR family NAD(P)-dependent oxidoreductase [Aeromicrobium sp. NPDC092404]|uniref:SDR family NAD(P)-dependent oxidoreductase n=1 Tax=Aeromicrobium sp. NPDC092404 TaxID=3154976 RepID=UPI003436A532